MTPSSLPPRLSVVIPAYNAALTLEAAVKSVQRQTRSDWEMVIVNDGSTDQTGMLAAALASRDGRIRVLWQANQGLGPARNAGIEACRGDFLFFLDSDDWIEPGTFERMMGRADRAPADVVIGGWVRERAGGEVVNRRRDILRDIEWSRDNVLRYAFASQLNLLSCGTLIRRQLVEDRGIRFRRVLHEDMYFMIRVYLYARGVAILTDTFYHWVVRAGSITSAFTKIHVDGYLGALVDRRELMEQEGIWEEYEPFLLLALAIHLRNAAERTEAMPDDQQPALWHQLGEYAAAFPERARWPEVLTDEQKETFAPVLARWLSPAEATAASPSSTAS